MRLTVNPALCTPLPHPLHAMHPKSCLQPPFPKRDPNLEPESVSRDSQIPPKDSRCPSALGSKAARCSKRALWARSPPIFDTRSQAPISSLTLLPSTVPNPPARTPHPSPITCHPPPLTPYPSPLSLHFPTLTPHSSPTVHLHPPFFHHQPPRAPHPSPCTRYPEP